MAGELLGKTGRRLAEVVWASRGPVLIVATVAVGLLLLMYGAGARSRQPRPEWFSEAWIGDVAWEAGKVVLGGGIVAGFLRVFHSIRLLETVLGEFLFSDDFLRVRNDLDDLWRRLTTMVYLRNYVDGDGGADSLNAKVQEEIRSRFAYDETFYIRDSVRQMTVSWHDRERSIISVEEETDYTIVPFDPGRPVQVRSRFRAHAGLVVSEYRIEGDVLRQMENGVPSEVSEDRTTTPEEIQIVYTLSGKDRYQVKRLRRMVWPLDRDRYLEVTTPYIIRNFEISVASLEKDIRTTFIEFGLKDKFVDSLAKAVASSNPGNVRRQLKGLMLPGRGFALFFEPVAASSAAAPTLQ